MGNFYYLTTALREGRKEGIPFLSRIFKTVALCLLVVWSASCSLNNDDADFEPLAEGQLSIEEAKMALDRVTNSITKNKTSTENTLADIGEYQLDWGKAKAKRRWNHQVDAPF